MGPQEQHDQQANAISLAAAPDSVSRKRIDYTRRRVWVLIGLHVLFLVHILHWRLSGKTLAPLEFNEVAYTLELGVVTAGFVFMALAVLATGIFGRFFCSWGCHILALQDLCRWMLAKVGIKPKPVRSRALSALPFLLLFYIFLWPQVRRVLVATWPALATWLGVPEEFAVRVTTDADGWSSFVTEDFWRNLPGPGVALTTFFVCGFAIVYLLGTRAFCRYGCPYGAIFNIVDRVAPGQLLAVKECQNCGLCTAACPSDVLVHKEIQEFGRVVDPGCMKDLDCVSSCPTGVIAYGFARPAFLTAGRAAGPRRKRAFSLGEEAWLCALFAVALLVFVGLPEDMVPWAGKLYGKASLFMSVALATMTAFLALHIWFLLRRDNVRLGKSLLKSQGKLRKAGMVFAGIGGPWLLLFAHSGLVQYHMFSAVRASQATSSLRAAALRGEEAVLASATPTQRALLQDGESHLRRAAALGLLPDERIERQSAWFALIAGDQERAMAHLRRAIELEPRYAKAHYQLGRLLAVSGKSAEAAEYLDHADQLSPPGRGFHHSFSRAVAQLMDMGLVQEGVALLSIAVRYRPQEAGLHARLGRTLLDRTRDAQGAIPHLKHAIALLEAQAGAQASDAADDSEVAPVADLRADLSQAYADTDSYELAMDCLQPNLEIPAARAGTLFMLGQLHQRQGHRAKALEFFRKAHALNPSFPSGE